MTELSATLCLTALALLGNQDQHPFILMGKYEKEFKALAYKELTGESPKMLIDLDREDVKSEYEIFVERLRMYYQNLFDQLGSGMDTAITKEAIEKKELRNKEKLAQIIKCNFISNNKVDYGDETVAQIAIRLNISKGEVRRRKQNGEL